MVIVSCKRVGPGPGGIALLANYTRGYHCRCGAELQVSWAGRLKIEAGGVPVCNRCALEFAQEAQRLATVELQTTPDGERALEDRSQFTLDSRALAAFVDRARRR
jgi:hypothetical protein